MRHAVLTTVLLVACSSPPVVEQPAPPPEPAPAATPEPRPAEWPHLVTIEGDTFAIPGDDGKKLRMRLAGYNTLESYGPVHRWGTWTGAELYALAKQAGTVAGNQAWTCIITDEEGGYGRKVADCPDLRAALLGQGLAHVFAVDDEPSATDIEVQLQAVESKAGMWAKGAPEGLITSLHSLDEKPDQEATYNRVAAVSTGVAAKHEHAESYTSCQEVCVGDAPPEGDGSCMLYVPYTNRYGDGKADCLVLE